MTFSLYHYLFLQQPDLPPMPGPLTYVVAANGVYLWAKRHGLEVLVPVLPAGTGLGEKKEAIESSLIRDLYPATPFIHLANPKKVGVHLVEHMLRVPTICATR